MLHNLRKAVHVVHKTDSFKDRQEFFEDYARQHLSLRLVLCAYRFLRFSPLSALIFAGFGMRYLIKPPFRVSKRLKLAYAVDYINEKRAVEALLETIADSPQLLTIPGLSVRGIQQIFRPIQIIWLLGRFYRFFRKYERRGSFLTCCRVSETLWLNSIAKDFLRREKASGVLVATNYSPTACALMAASRSSGLPVVYTFHAIIPYDFPIPQLEADLALLYGKKAIEALEFNGRLRCKRICFSGLPGESRPMRVVEDFADVKRVGVFLTGYTIQSAFERLIESLNAYTNIKEILVRPHPLPEANPDTKFLARFAKVRVDGSGRAADAAANCDFVIAGSSSVHIDVLKAGTPSLYWEEFDTVGPDYYRLLQNRVVAELSSLEKLDWHRVRDFYKDQWTKIFKEFDISYLQDREAIVGNIRSEVERLLMPTFSAVPEQLAIQQARPV